MYVVKITTDKLSTLTETAEKMLRYGGKLMQCLDEIQREGGEDMGERRQADYRDPYMQRVQWRDDNRFRDDGESLTPMMGERGGMRYGHRGGGSSGNGG